MPKQIPFNISGGVLVDKEGPDEFPRSMLPGLRQLWFRPPLPLRERVDELRTSISVGFCCAITRFIWRADVLVRRLHLTAAEDSRPPGASVPVKTLWRRNERK